jgi:hypothetical protein
MRLLGRASWSKEDYELCYAIKQGYVQLPKGSLFNPDSYNLGQDGSANLKRGLFNVRRWAGELKDPKFLRKDNDPFPEMPGGGGLSGQGAIANLAWPGISTGDSFLGSVKGSAGVGGTAAYLPVGQQGSYFTGLNPT